MYIVNNQKYEVDAEGLFNKDNAILIIPIINQDMSMISDIL